MKDSFGREIDYMRISLTDRCNLRCIYCRPETQEYIPHSEILRYEEILKVCRAAVISGINKFKVTGGEPLMRKGAVEFIGVLKSTEGVNCVTLTTNGLLLESALPALAEAGIDGINISLNSLNDSTYESITGRPGAKTVLKAVKACAESGVKTKINAVLLQRNADELLSIAALVEALYADVRFIELMPLGGGAELCGMSGAQAISVLKECYPDLERSDEIRGNGPAVYYTSALLKGRIGIIAPNSSSFCTSCSRVRLTSTGKLKPCLCYQDGIDLKPVLRRGGSETELSEAIKHAVNNKPAGHCFNDVKKVTERSAMNRIGG